VKWAAASAALVLSSCAHLPTNSVPNSLVLAKWAGSDLRHSACRKSEDPRDICLWSVDDAHLEDVSTVTGPSLPNRVDGWTILHTDWPKEGRVLAAVGPDRVGKLRLQVVGYVRPGDGEACFEAKQAKDYEFIVPKTALRREDKFCFPVS